MEIEPERCAIRIIAENRKGVLRDIATVVAQHEANIVMINQEVFDSGRIPEWLSSILNMMPAKEATVIS